MGVYSYAPDTRFKYRNLLADYGKRCGLLKRAE